MYCVKLDEALQLAMSRATSRREGEKRRGPFNRRTWGEEAEGGEGRGSEGGGEAICTCMLKRGQSVRSVEA